jgi:hypothetical protein
MIKMGRRHMNDVISDINIDGSHPAKDFHPIEVSAQKDTRFGALGEF